METLNFALVLLTTLLQNNQDRILALAQPKVVLAETIPDKLDEYTIRSMIKAQAKKYPVNEEEVFKTLKCENRGFEPEKQSDVIDKYGKREDSWGLAQIHLPSHPNITKEQAQDPNFSIEFIVKNFSKGNKEIWSCYKKIYLPVKVE